MSPVHAGCGGPAGTAQVVGPPSAPPEPTACPTGEGGHGKGLPVCPVSMAREQPFMCAHGSLMRGIVDG